MNNFRHGLAGGGFYFLDEEDPEQYDNLLNALMQEHNADTATELILIEKMAKSHWLAQRAIKFQTLTQSGDNPYETIDEVSKWARYQNTHERNFERGLNQLLKLREHKTKEQIGFESLKAREAEQIRKEAEEIRKVEKHQATVERIHASTERLKQTPKRQQTVKAEPELTPLQPEIASEPVAQPAPEEKMAA